MFAAQFAAALGARVFVTSSSPEKIRRATEVIKGVEGGVLYTSPDWSAELLRLTGGRRLQVVVDGGGGEGVMEALKACDRGARLCTYGSTAGPNVTLAFPLVFLAQIHIHGSSGGSAKDFRDMLRLIAEKRIVPIVDSEFAFDELPEALERMRSAAQFGKIVLVHGDGEGRESGRL